jgi:hypothetical protein
MPHEIAEMNSYVTSIIEQGDIKTQSPDCFSPYDERLPDELLKLYERLDNCLSEVIIGRWHIMSVVDAYAHNSDLYNCGETTIYNFARAYCRYGVIIMAAIDLTNGKVFIRREGGNNGYEIQFNLNKIINYRKNSKRFTSKLLEFRTFMHLCISERPDNILITDAYFIH